MKNQKHKDLETSELLKEMEKKIKEGFTCFVKWTCEKCNERVTCTTPNAFFTKGFCHQEKSDGSPCGFVSYPKKFGLAIMIAV